MSELEFDHVFICTESISAGQDAMQAMGFHETLSREHPGQGTANHLYGFNNAVLELLYVNKKDDLQSELTSPTKLYQRFYDDTGKVSPFGLCLRPSKTPVDKLPFAHWQYRPTYLPPHLKIEVADSSELEPMWFYLPFAARPDQKADWPGDKQRFKEITSISITCTSTQPLSTAGTTINQLKDINVLQGDEHLLELEFDDGVCNQRHDCRPSLPLVLCW